MVLEDSSGISEKIQRSVWKMHLKLKIVLRKFLPRFRNVPRLLFQCFFSGSVPFWLFTVFLWKVLPRQFSWDLLGTSILGLECFSGTFPEGPAKIRSPGAILSWLIMVPWKVPVKGTPTFSRFSGGRAILDSNRFS